MIEEIKVRLIGESPLMMHNGRLADPLNPWAVKLAEFSGLRKKTEAQHIAMRRVEWFGSMYEGDDGLPAIPGANVVATIIDGAKAQRRGKQAKVGIFAAQPFFPLRYEGPKNLDDLYDDPRFVSCMAVRVGQARVMRTRPVFRDWSCEASIFVKTDSISVSHALDALTTGGECVGILEHRPTYGRFRVES